MTDGSFSAWLAGLCERDLAGLLAARPDATAAPQPVTLGELAERLSLPHGVFAALAAANLPQLQLLETLAALGDGTPHAQVRALLDDAIEDDFAAVVAGLLRCGLVWPQGDRLRLAEPLRDWPLDRGPLGLGPPAAVLLPHLTADVLRRVARELGVPVTGKRKSDLLEAVLSALGDDERVRQVVTAAPPAVRTLVETTARNGAVPAHHHVYMMQTTRDDDPYAWALTRGLLVQLDWQAPVMPAEVALALRGPAYRAPFSPAEPVPATMAVPVEAAEAEFAAVATRAVQELTSLLRACADRPPARRKSGGVGVRELRRIAKEAGCTEEAARLWLELAGSAGLVDFDGTDLVPTGAFDEWQHAEPVERLVPLLRTWERMPRLPLLADPDDGTRAAPLDHRAHDPAAPRLRAAVLRALATLPAGRGVRGPEAVTTAVLWHRPLMFEDPELAPPYVAAVWQEAELLGVLAHGALTPAGRALTTPQAPSGGTATADDGQAPVQDATRHLKEIVADALAAECTTILLQADLTAIVPGPPSARLTDLLDHTADRESRQTASVWRFSPRSIRRALDQGSTATELLAELRAAAATELPQPLEYLINDVARRHGEVVVTPLASAICCPTPGLLSEIHANRRLRSLGLRELAPTVLASTKPVPDTLAALRDAGYLPAGQGPGGVPLIERAPKRRTEAPPTTSPAARPARHRRAAKPKADRSAQPSPEELARRLHGTPTSPPTGSAPDEQLARIAPQLTATERRLLSHALDTGEPIHIDYVNNDGNPSRRVIENAALDIPPLITAWCHLRDDERNFHAGRITAITPAN
jgi:hypothetical protein